jgi:hypothetical protein
MVTAKSITRGAFAAINEMHKIRNSNLPQWCAKFKPTTKHMSLAELKEHVVTLTVEEQAELASFLSDRFRQNDPQYRELLARLIDDHNKDQWVKWDDLKKQLDKLP